MTFYNALQMDPAILKAKIAQCDTPAEKRFYWFAMALRSLLIVGFAVVFISGPCESIRSGQHPFGSGAVLYPAGYPFRKF